jgi:hypothetical protein
MSVPYIDGSGALRQRKAASGDGSNADPDNFTFADIGTYERLGDIDAAPLSTPIANGSIGAVIRGFWNAIGNNNDLASFTGSVHAKLRSLIDVIGTTTDALSATGTLMSRLRVLTEGLGVAADTASRTGSVHAKLRSLAEINYIESQTANAITIATTLTVVNSFDCRGKKILGVQLQNTGSTALSGLQVQMRFNNALTIWNTIASTDADFTTNNGKQSNNSNTEIISSGVSGGTIITIPAGGTAWFRVRCEGMESLRIQAVVASGGTTMLAHGIAEI